MRAVAPILLFASVAVAQQPAAPTPPFSESPYKVLQRAKVGGEGGTDYIHFGNDGKIYITRNSLRAAAATATTPARDSVPGRVTIFDGKTLAPLGEILNGGGNGAVVDVKSGHGFASSHPNLTMFDIRTKQMIKEIDPNADNPNAQPKWSADGIYFDPSDNRVYIGSHPTKDLIVLDVNDGKVYGKIPLGGVPEQTVSDGKGTLYVALQDSAGGIAVVDQKAMKVTKTYPIGDIGRCNGLALDVKNGVLFMSCALGRENGPTPQPVMAIVSAKDGKILAKLPLAGASDGAAFNPQTMQAFSSHGNGTITVIKEKSPTSFEIEQNLETMNGARTITMDPATGNLFVMSVERGPVPTGGRGAGPAIPGSFTVVKVGKP
jgi:hypothetical protein